MVRCEMFDVGPHQFIQKFAAPVRLENSKTAANLPKADVVRLRKSNHIFIAVIGKVFT